MRDKRVTASAFRQMLAYLRRDLEVRLQPGDGAGLAGRKDSGY
ncbi:hypothetical protein [Bacillus salacetis]|nr:hypothetical protein [Bacillus salacetis]